MNKRRSVFLRKLCGGNPRAFRWMKRDWTLAPAPIRKARLMEHRANPENSELAKMGRLLAQALTPRPISRRFRASDPHRWLRLGGAAAIMFRRIRALFIPDPRRS
jgi:hypothetical protein